MIRLVAYLVAPQRLKPRCNAIAAQFLDIGHAEMTQIFSEPTECPFTE